MEDAHRCKLDVLQSRTVLFCVSFFHIHTRLYRKSHFWKTWMRGRVPSMPSLVWELTIFLLQRKGNDYPRLQISLSTLLGFLVVTKSSVAVKAFYYSSYSPYNLSLVTTAKNSCKSSVRTYHTGHLFRCFESKPFWKGTYAIGTEQT